VSGEVGSTGDIDATSEDFSAKEEARQTGFIGKTSEITWGQRLRDENQFGSSSSHESRLNPEGTRPLFGECAGEPMHRLPEVDESYAVRNASYHLDDFAISTFDMVDRYELPTPETATRLYNTYLQRVHYAFPIIGKTTFTGQFGRFMEGKIPGGRWLAILNLIFAISARYSHLVQAEWRGDERDHLIYFTRARLLSMNGESIFEHPDLQQIQVSGLIAWYFLCTGQINR